MDRQIGELLSEGIIRPYNSPGINSILASLGGARYFTTLDLASGFHHLHMKPSDTVKTAFSTLNGKYKILRLPFGLKNAPAIFQRMIDDVLREYIVEAITKMKHPKNDKELKSFFAMTSFYKKFIRDYAKVAKPLTNLTRGESARIKANQSKKVPSDLDDADLQAFDGLKTILPSSEALAFPDFGKPFHLTTDASNYALGAVLSQDIEGKDRPIACISRTISKTEENYATIEKDMLAIVWALGNPRSYLYGAASVKVCTDHQPLTFALGSRNFNAKLSRWKARIEEYNCVLIYKPGKSNVVADALSRIVPINHYFDWCRSDTASAVPPCIVQMKTRLICYPTWKYPSTFIVTNLSLTPSVQNTFANNPTGASNVILFPR